MCSLSLYFFIFDCLRPVCQLIHELHPCRYDKMGSVAEKNLPRRWSALYNDCNRWRCFATHFHSFVVINKVALNCIRSYFRLLLKKYCWSCLKRQIQFLGCFFSSSTSSHWDPPALTLCLQRNVAAELIFCQRSTLWESLCTHDTVLMLRFKEAKSITCGERKPARCSWRQCSCEVCQGHKSNLICLHCIWEAAGKLNSWAKET